MILQQNTAHVRSNDYPAYPGAVFHADGMAVVGRMVEGQFVAYPSNGKAGLTDGEIFLGFSHMRMTGAPTDQLYASRVEEQLVGPSGKGRLQQIPLPNTMGAYNLTQKMIDPAVTVDTQGNYEGATAGEEYRFVYKWALTRQNRISLFGDAQPGGPSGGATGQIGVIQTAEIIYLDQFDTTVDWACGCKVHTMGIGQITTSNSDEKGIELPGVVVVDLPTADRPYLGLQFSAQNI